MTSDGHALLASILAAPDDDAPRLIYADWLDEHAEPERAEFVRVQCALAGYYAEDGRHVKDCYIGGCAPGETLKGPHPCKVCGPLWALRRREWELWADTSWATSAAFGMQFGVEPAWLIAISDAISGERIALIRRGFVHSLTCTAADALEHLDTIRAAQPVREVRLTTWPDLQPPYTENPWGGRIMDRWPAGYTKTCHLDRWPGIDFHLPPEPPQVGPDGGFLVPARFVPLLRQMMNDHNRTLALASEPFFIRPV